MPRLFILRHAKAMPPTRTMADHDRPLAKSATRTLTKLGSRLDHRLHGRRIDLVLCSTAQRAWETVAGLLPHLGAPEVRTDDRLYLASAGELLDVLSELPDDVGSALVCGHNPGLHELAMALVGSADATPALRHGLPTAGVVVVDLEAGWTSIGRGTGKLADFIVPAD